MKYPQVLRVIPNNLNIYIKLFSGISLKCWKCEISETSFDKECLLKPPEISGSSFQQPEGYTEEECEDATATCAKGHVGRSHTLQFTGIKIENPISIHIF